MEGSDSSSRRLIPEDASAAEFLIDRANLKLLEQFWNRENTVAGVARTLELPANAVLYRVKKMLRLGLLEVARLEARAGRAVAHYRLAAEEFYIPFAVTRFETKAAFVRAQLEPLFVKLIEAEGRTTAEDQAAGGWGVRMVMNECGNTLTQTRLRSQAMGDLPQIPKKSIRAWGTALFAPQRAQRIITQLAALMQEITDIDEEGPAATPYVFQLTMVELEQR